MLNNLFPKIKVMFSTSQMCPNFFYSFLYVPGQMEPAEALFSSFIQQYHKIEHFTQKVAYLRHPRKRENIASQLCWFAKVIVFYFSLCILFFAVLSFMLE